MLNSLYEGFQTIQTGDFQYLMSSIFAELKHKGLQVDRLQMPMNKVSGLRHPKYAVIILTFIDDELDVIYIPQSKGPALPIPGIFAIHHLDL